MLRIETEDISTDLQLLRLFGALDGLTYLELLKVLNQSIDQDTKRIVLDMSEVDYVSSAGLRVLLQGAKSLKEIGGEIVLFAMNSTVREVFKMSGFDSLFRSYATETEALS